MDRADGGQHPLHEPADILHGEKINNPANDVNSESTASFRSRDRSLSPTEIRIMLILLKEGGDAADHHARPEVHFAQHGLEERTPGTGVDRGEFRACGLVDPGRTHEALTPSQRLPSRLKYSTYW